jgi:hypothetical protein
MDGRGSDIPSKTNSLHCSNWAATNRHTKNQLIQIHTNQTSPLPDTHYRSTTATLFCTEFDFLYRLLNRRVQRKSLGWCVGFFYCLMFYVSQAPTIHQSVFLTLTCLLLIYMTYEALQRISPPTFCFKASSRSKTPRLVLMIAISPGRKGLINLARRPAARSFISFTVKVTFFEGLLITLRLLSAGLLSLYLRVSQSLRVAMLAGVVGV